MGREWVAGVGCLGREVGWGGTGSGSGEIGWVGWDWVASDGMGWMSKAGLGSDQMGRE